MKILPASSERLVIYVKATLIGKRGKAALVNILYCVHQRVLSDLCSVLASLSSLFWFVKPKPANQNFFF